MPSKDFYLKWQEKQKLSKGISLILKVLGIYIAILYIVVVFGLLKTGNGIRLFALAMTALFFYRAIVSESIHFLFPRPRPYQKYLFHPINSAFFTKEHTRLDSFPSDHTGSLIAISVVLWTWNPLVGFVGILFAIATGLSRVLLGYHHFVDILGGAIIGTVSSLIVLYLARYLGY